MPWHLGFPDEGCAWKPITLQHLLMMVRNLDNMVQEQKKAARAAKRKAG